MKLAIFIVAATTSFACTKTEIRQPRDQKGGPSAASTAEPVVVDNQNSVPEPQQASAPASDAQTGADTAAKFQVVRSLGEVPPCADDNKGKFYFVLETYEFNYCDGQSLSVLDLRQGPQDTADLAERLRRVWRQNIASTAIITHRYGVADRPECLVEYMTGSGFIVGKDAIVTNGHVVDIARTIEPNPAIGEAVGCDLDVLPYLETGIYFPATSTGITDYQRRDPDTISLAVDRQFAVAHDIVILSADTGDRAPVSISQRGLAAGGTDGEGLRLGDDVLLLGFGAGIVAPQFAAGTVLSALPAQDFGIGTGTIAPTTTLISYDSASVGGTSGGAVYDLLGEVVAVNFASLPGSQYHYGVAAHHLTELLARERVMEPIVEPIPVLSLDATATFTVTADEAFRPALYFDGWGVYRVEIVSDQSVELRVGATRYRSGTSIDTTVLLRHFGYDARLSITTASPTAQFSIRMSEAAPSEANLGTPNNLVFSEPNTIWLAFDAPASATYQLTAGGAAEELGSVFVAVQDTLYSTRFEGEDDLNDARELAGSIYAFAGETIYVGVFSDAAQEATLSIIQVAAEE